jgi:hypothetical protein
MFEMLQNWLFTAIKFVIDYAGTILLVIFGLGILEWLITRIWPCAFGHSEEAVRRVLYDSPSVQTSTIDFYCKRCGKKL